MAPVTDYTNTDRIRAVLGVTDNEVSDEVIENVGLEAFVLEVFDDIASDHAAQYVAGTDEQATAAQARVARLMETYATWYAASQLPSLGMQAPERFSDGKTSYQRAEMRYQSFPNAHFVQRKARYWRRRLLLSMGLQEETSTPALSVASTPGYDPVTEP